MPCESIRMRHRLVCECRSDANWEQESSLEISVRGVLPLLYGCPCRVLLPGYGHPRQCSWKPASVIRTDFILLRRFRRGSRIADTKIDLNFPTRYAMLGQLNNFPTDTLIDMLFIILAGDSILTAADVAELEQIQRELQRRGEGCSASVN